MPSLAVSSYIAPSKSGGKQVLEVTEYKGTSLRTYVHVHRVELECSPYNENTVETIASQRNNTDTLFA